MDYLQELRCEENLREAFILAQHVMESHKLWLEQSQQPSLTPFWELRIIERLTLALYLERSSPSTLSAIPMLSYPSGSKLIEAAEGLRERSLITPAVDEMLFPLHLRGDSKVSFRATALAHEVLSGLEEKNFDRRTKPLLGNWS